jgi:signal transduction histidine kinase
MRAPLPDNESARLEALRAYDVLDTPPEQAFDDMTRLAAQILGTPMAMVSLVDGDRQWYKSHHGTELTETPRDVAFCAHAILQPDLFVVPDAHADARFADNPLVDGEPQVRFYAGAPLVTPDGHALGTLCAVDRVPHELTEAQGEALRALARQTMVQLRLRRSLKQLQELEAMRDSLTHMIVHDLRTPLTSFLSGVQTLDVLGELNAEQQEVVALTVGGGETLLSMINDLLDVSKMEDGSLTLERSELCPGDLADRAVLQVGYLAREKGLALDQQTADLPLFQGDEEKLVRTLVNLLGNAVKFTPAGGRVTVSVSADGDEAILFRVADTGEGIPKEAFSRIFEKFGQVETRKSGRRMSTGLGLTFCKMVVEAHGGRIWVESEPGQGSTFAFVIPRA